MNEIVEMVKRAVAFLRKQPPRSLVAIGTIAAAGVLMIATTPQSPDGSPNEWWPLELAAFVGFAVGIGIALRLGKRSADPLSSAAYRNPSWGIPLIIAALLVFVYARLVLER